MDESLSRRKRFSELFEPSDEDEDLRVQMHAVSRPTAASGESPCSPKSIAEPRFDGDILGAAAGMEPAAEATHPDPADRASSFVINPFLGSPRCSLFGVIHSHGRCGKEISLYVANSFTTMFEKRINAGLEPSEALTAAFIDTDMALVADRSIDSSQSGTMSNVSFVDDGVLYTARAVSGRRLLGS